MSSRPNSRTILAEDLELCQFNLGLVRDVCAFQECRYQMTCSPCGPAFSLHVVANVLIVNLILR
jgi:hypothetical protein